MRAGGYKQHVQVCAMCVSKFEVHDVAAGSTWNQQQQAFDCDVLVPACL
jgi:hypothetical protein